MRKRTQNPEPPPLPALTAALQEVLDRIPNTTSATAFQQAIAAELRGKGWELRMEEPTVDGKNGRTGRLDILVTQPALIAIEVDRRTPRQNSIAKLRSINGYRFVVLREGLPNGPIEGIDAVLAPSGNRPCANGQRAFTGGRWWLTHEGIEQKGHELGLEAGKGESWEVYKQRVLDKTEEAKRIAGDRTTPEHRQKVAGHLEEIRSVLEGGQRRVKKPP